MKTYTIYDHPLDYPNHFVMRVFEVSSDGSVTPTSSLATSTSLTEIRALIPPECVCIARHPGDDLVIVETWI